MKEFKKKINIRNKGYNLNKKITKNPLILCILEPNKDLLKKKIITHKEAFLHECKKRDILISNKLKCEFDNYEDIKRILNGKKPLKDIIKN